jgi:hypothetical protein
MGRRLSEWLILASRWWVALAAVVVFALFVALVLPGQSGDSEVDAGSPDLSFYYSAGELYDMAEAYGPEGRQAYIRARFTFDVVWPLVYGSFLVTALSWLCGRAFGPGSNWRLLNLLPLAAVVFDFVENAMTSLVMARYPVRTPVVAELAGVATAVKWSMLGAAFAALLPVAAIAIWGRFRRETSPAD